MNKTSRLTIAHRRATAAWLCLDAFTDADTLSRMIEVAFEGRNQRKAEQRQDSTEQSTAMRVRVIERDGSTCYMCHRRLAFEEITLEHVIPKSRGGATSESNLRVACEPCNNRKGNRLVEECEWLNP